MLKQNKKTRPCLTVRPKTAVSGPERQTFITPSIFKRLEKKVRDLHTRHNPLNKARTRNSPSRNVARKRPGFFDILLIATKLRRSSRTMYYISDIDDVISSRVIYVFAREESSSSLRLSNRGVLLIFESCSTVIRLRSPFPERLGFFFFVFLQPCVSTSTTSPAGLSLSSVSTLQLPFDDIPLCCHWHRHGSIAPHTFAKISSQRIFEFYLHGSEKKIIAG